MAETAWRVFGAMSVGWVLLAGCTSDDGDGGAGGAAGVGGAGGSGGANEPLACGAVDGQPSYGTIDELQAARMMSVAGTAEDGPFYMVNLIKYREKACYRDGRETDLTGREADELYQPLEFLAAIGAEVVFVAEAETTLLGDGTEWDSIGIVRYPSRADFFAMTEDEAFQARAVHKDAGLEQSIVMVTDLLPSQLPADFVPNESPFPATADDPPVEVLHLLKFREQAEYPPGSDEPPRTGEEAMALYEAAAGPVAIELGAYPAAWFEVEGVLIGDGRDWDQFRINHMPSHLAFNTLVADPDRLAGQVHREAGLEDTYTVLAQALLNSVDQVANP